MKGCWSVLTLFKEPRFYYQSVFWFFPPQWPVGVGEALNSWWSAGVRRLRFLTLRGGESRVPGPCRGSCWDWILGFLSCLLVRHSSTIAPSLGCSGQRDIPEGPYLAQNRTRITVPHLALCYEWKSAWVSSEFERFRLCHGSVAYFPCNLGQVI